MLRILIIDDEPTTVEHIKDELLTRDPSFHVEILDFTKGAAALTSFSPHIVILDLIKGAAADGVDEGSILLKDVWGKKCCPTIIHSARANEMEETFQGNPYVICVVKGSGADVRVAEGVSGFKEKIASLCAVEGKIHASLNAFLTGGLSLISTSGSEVIERCALRHIAASIDNHSLGQPLEPWECFLVIPVDASAQLGDLLRIRAGEPSDPSSYLVILTPSCDLVATNGRVSKVQDVLVAQCKSLDVLRNVCGLSETGKAKFEKSIKGLLNHGYYESVMPLPSFLDRWPELAVDFRDLKTIPISQIGLASTTDDTEYLRVASLDSPFRETVAWAYAQYTAKIALPDRDVVAWSASIGGSLSFQ